MINKKKLVASGERRMIWEYKETLIKIKISANWKKGKQDSDNAWSQEKMFLNIKNRRSNCQHSLVHRKRREFQKNIYFCFIDYAKVSDSVGHNKLWKILKEMGIPDQLTCPLRNLYEDQEATVRTRHGTTNWFQIGRGVHQGCILSPCLFNSYAEYMMWSTGLDEAQTGIQIARRNINNLIYTDDATLMAKSKEKLKSLFHSLLESENVGLKFNIQKMKIMASGPVSSVQFNSVAQSCPPLCKPMNCSTVGLPVHHQLLESTQTHVHWVGDTIQPSHPLSSPCPPALNLSQH